MLNLIQFKQACLSDLPAIVATYNATVSGRMVTADLEPVSVSSREEWFYNHQPETRPLYLIEYDKAYAGWMSFNSFYGRPAYHKTAELSIYLETTAQGKGLGNVALTHAIKKCPELQITRLLGFIFGHNEPSLKLFYKHGFEKWAHLPEVAEMDNQLRDLLILGKKIDPIN